MMPVPTHLRECLHPKEASFDESELIADLRCTCGGEEFHLHYPGQTHEYKGEMIPCTAEMDGDFFFLIRADCTSCNKTYLLIDQDFHGWDGFVCHDEQQAKKPRPELIPWKCLHCDGLPHSATVTIELCEKEDYLEEDDLDPERWVDAFSWFSIDTVCKTCGRSTEDWVSLETA